jgi:DNA topoisomerase-1
MNASSVLDPVASAKSAGLRYVMDQRPGITRARAGKGFSYAFPDGTRVRDQETVARIRKLAIPPAWTRVWISPFANGHIQATGRDVKGRKQYRYHERWREVRDDTKYEKMIGFGRALPKIRQAVDRDLKRSGLPREKVLASVVRLLEVTHIRVGNEEYARTNKSYGLTTILQKHVEVEGTTVSFRFRGKSGKEHSIDIRDRRVAKIVDKCSDLPGHELFQYLDENGESHDVESSHVNAYLKELAGEELTAKDFRTWAGTVLAARALSEAEAFESTTQANKNIVAAIKTVSASLGNTPSVCRKCYVHPGVLDAYLDGTLKLDAVKAADEQVVDANDASFELSHEETAVLTLLEAGLTKEGKYAAKARLSRQLLKSVAAHTHKAKTVAKRKAA